MSTEASFRSLEGAAMVGGGLGEHGDFDVGAAEAECWRSRGQVAEQPEGTAMGYPGEYAGEQVDAELASCP